MKYDVPHVEETLRNSRGRALKKSIRNSKYYGDEETGLRRGIPVIRAERAYF